VTQYGERNSGTKTLSGQPQVYDALLERCLQRRELFEDPEFQCKDSSVFGSKQPDMAISWRRPGEISENPLFCKDGFSRFDVKQGSLGNCWVVASTAILTIHKELFNRVVPSGQSFEDGKYAGIFHFVLWKDNRWVDVVIDDRLPVDEDGDLVFMTSNTDGEFWSALLEKAYAKLHGSYKALEGGSGIESMSVYTGGLTEQIILEKPPKNLFKIMEKAFERSSLVTCSNIDKEKCPEGIIAFHEYSVTDVKRATVTQVTGTDGEERQLIRVRNPWGSTEWKGSWSDASSQWNLITEEQRQEMNLTVEDDGEFWYELQIPFEDFLKIFQMLDFCHLEPASLTDEMIGGRSKRWEVSTFEGSWVPGSSAGGGDEENEQFASNPQYMITLDEPDDDNEDGECTVIVALLQKNRRRLEVEEKWRTVGFCLYEVEDPCKCPVPLTLEYLADNTKVAEHGGNSHEVTSRLRLLPGSFCVIPCTQEPDQAGEFLLRIYTEKKSLVKEHDETATVIEKAPFTLDKCPIDENGDAKEPGEKNEVDGETGDSGDEKEEEEIDESLKKLFMEVAGDDETVCCWSLQTLLKNVFEKEGKAQEFSLDLCRSMVALIDDDYSGSLDLEEFALLHKYIKKWEEAFRIHDKDSCGSLSIYELRKALGSAGYRVNQHVLKGLVLRYGHDRMISFQDFIGCAVKLMCMIGA
ncbi:unnamed protein product, partial [Ixodes hexagonus]